MARSRILAGGPRATAGFGLALLLATSVAVAACSGEAGSPGAPTDTPAQAIPTDALAPAITEPPPIVDAAAKILGPWLQTALHRGETAEVVTATEAACRAALAAAGGAAARAAAAPRVIADVRGAAVAWLVFADNDREADCRAQIADDLSVTVVGTSAVEDLGPAPADDGIEYIAYGTLQDVPSGRTFALGRAGRQSLLVIAGFPDESEALASMGSGWYLVWWPGAVEPTGIGGVDNRRVVVAGMAPPTAAP
jgi:hypothetical protein